MIALKRSVKDIKMDCYKLGIIGAVVSTGLHGIIKDMIKNIGSMLQLQFVVHL